MGAFAHGHSFLLNNERKSFPSLVKKEKLSKYRRKWFTLGHKKREKPWKTVKKYQKYVFCESLVFWEQFPRITSKSLTLLFFKEIESCSFVKSNKSDLLMAAHFWAILSERAKKANSQPCIKPVFCINGISLVYVPDICRVYNSQIMLCTVLPMLHQW